MCGICGVAYGDGRRRPGRARLERMADSLRHRGPDGSGFFVGSGLGLGFARLSIIDLETGDQPLRNEDGSLRLVCNGEIYNYVELRRELEGRGHHFMTGSDAEVVLHLYEELGTDCLQRLRGMFALALWDGSRRQLMLARDRFGIKPLCYALDRERLLFGSEAKAILAHGGVDVDLDVRALADAFHFGFVSSPQTMVRAIRCLPAAHFGLYRDGELRLHRYWDLDLEPGRRQRRSPAQWAEALRQQLDASVRFHLRSDVEVGAWLSGGIDSSAVVRLAGLASDHPIQTFYLAFGPSSFDERRRGPLLTDDPSLGLRPWVVPCGPEVLDQLELAIWHGEELTSGGADLARLRLARQTSERVKVVLTGEGADEILGGYAWYRQDKILRPLRVLPGRLRRALVRWPCFAKRWPTASHVLAGEDEVGRDRFGRWVGVPGGKRLISELWTRELQERWASSPPSQAPPLPAEFGRWLPQDQLHYLDISVRLCGSVVHKLDRSAMARSVEARVPFLDHPLVELCASMPPQIKLRGFEEKAVLRRAMRGLLPESIRQRPKYPLQAPLVEWLRGPLPEPLAELLSPSCLRDKGLFEPTAVAALLEQHRRGRQSLHRALFVVLGAQIWHELFVRRRGIGASLLTGAAGDA